MRLLLAGIAVASVFLFQNCGKPFNLKEIEAQESPNGSTAFPEAGAALSGLELESGKPYALRNVSADRCLNVPLELAYAGLKFEFADCHLNERSQAFTGLKTSEGRYVFQSLSSKKCLSDDTQEVCTELQSFKAVAAGNNGYRLQKAGREECLSADEAGVRLKPCDDNSASQIFDFLPTSAEAFGESSGREILDHQVGYRGYTMDFSEVTERSQLPEILRSIAKQIDVVENSLANAATKAFFRSVLIRVRPRLGNQGTYSATNGMSMNAAVVSEDKIVLLHELLHAYHHQVLSFANTDVETYFQRATLRNLWPDSYLRSNKNEFFAVTASVALYGKAIDREPFTDAELSQNMPEWRAWIRRTLQE